MPKLSARQLIGANFSFQRYPFEKVAEIIRGFGFAEIELRGIAPYLQQTGEVA
ncbi:hypothetical protein HJB79_05115 [Rhizobium lentis]|uniref:hypothetical protein n=1 Tax=Rhizobium TaxID=379 RepID=UPI00161DB02A|nr:MULTISPECIES: hypothetical protein [Rhizobium]MBB3352594.1 sugar phosphate isomerase/epimerase [Rhizobium sp. BK049]MBX5135979.1 hypothetical protein [Rhizobium lentis]MBX5138186.1 hypothetical protein [Rhizobium lentis]MBX5151290.1 hypothetical protein [Rhizobium lentis]MBX5176460.1 hypothetical protein [Rhizobium lentis]